MNKLLLAVCVIAMSAGCARRGRAPVASAMAAHPTNTVSALRAQLSGHLDRARGCFTEARLRDPNASGLVHYAFTIEPSGRVQDVEIDAWSADSDMLAACVRSRMVSLYFDPAPPRDVRIERTFVVCPDEERGLCRLGLAGGPTDLMQRVAEGLDERTAALEACAERVGETSAILDVRLELGPDGRIMEGQLHRAAPEGTPLARCAVGPLLGARVAGEHPGETTQLRYVYRLGGGPDSRTASR